MSQPTNQTANDSRGLVELTEDERHRLLAAGRRQVVLDAVTAEMSSFGLTELAREVAAREDGIRPDDESDVERVAVTLHHAHLPLMAELGTISYDPERQQIEPHRGLTTL